MKSKEKAGKLKRCKKGKKQGENIIKIWGLNYTPERIKMDSP